MKRGMLSQLKEKTTVCDFKIGILKIETFGELA